MQNQVLEYIEKNKKNGILYKADYLLKQAGSDIDALDNAVNEISELISFLPSDTLQEDYAERIAKQHKLKANRFTKRISDFVNARNEKIKELQDKENGIPKWIDTKKFFTLGFDSKVDGVDNTGIYFHTGSGGVKQLTNFTMKPLIHVYSQDEQDNRRLTEVNNGLSCTVLQLPSQAFTSADKFESILMNEGVYFTMDGFAKSHLNKLKSVLLKEYPKCYELKTLGWQPEGFWAYSNKIFNGNLLAFNKYGYVDVEGTNYLSMSASSIQSELRQEEDQYQNDRYLSWRHAELDFKPWAKLFFDVYGHNAYFGITFVFVTLFRDIVFSRDNSCPLLYPYGAVSSGKSKFAESVSNLFFNELKPFNLNQGTDFAFFNRLERYRNCPAVFNEFDENEIKEEWFRALKAGFDGEGRVKGSMSKRNKTVTQEINSTIIMIGQFLSTKDDASVLSRSLPCLFKEKKDRSTEEVELYERLKGYEKKGLSGILIELLQHRKLIEENYVVEFSKNAKALNRAINEAGVQIKIRILNNFCAPLTMMSLLQGKLDFPFSYDDFFTVCKEEIIKLSSMISESDSLANFWKSIEFMLGQDMIESGFDFKIETLHDVSLLISRADVGNDGNNTRKITFEEPKRLLFLRLNSVHPIYMKEVRTQTGKTGLNQETILTYMKDQAYYIGCNKSSSFRSKNGKSTITSSYVFDYDAMNVNLLINEDMPGKPATITGEIAYKNAIVTEVMGNMKGMFTIKLDKSSKQESFVPKLGDVKVWTNQLELMDKLKVGATVRVAGTYNERGTADRIYRDIHADKIEIINVQAMMALPGESDWTEG